MLIAARIIGGQSTMRMPDERVSWHLWNWERWQFRNSGQITAGFSNMAGDGCGSVQSRDFDSLVDSADEKCASAVEAILNDCSVGERAAVHHVHLRAVFRFSRPGYTLDDAYQSAFEKIRAGLQKKGIQ